MKLWVWRGFTEELQVAARELARGYYGWREGLLQTLRFKDESQASIHPELNAGSVAIQHLFAGLYTPASFYPNLYGESGFLALYQQMFGDPAKVGFGGGEVIPRVWLSPHWRCLSSPGSPGRSLPVRISPGK